MSRVVILVIVCIGSPLRVGVVNEDEAPTAPHHRVMENADVFLGLHDFLERMRQPAAADFVKAIKRSVILLISISIQSLLS